jgi:hypothetical protein
MPAGNQEEEMHYTIRAPMPTFDGNMHDVRFHAGTGVAELEDSDVAWFQKRGYAVEPVVPEDGEGPRYPELQAEAKALGLPASGKKAELAAAIAEERLRLDAMPKDGSQQFVGDMNAIAGSSSNGADES